MESAEELERLTKTVCELYEQAPGLEAQGIHVYSTDECTGIQALERQEPDLPMQAGKPRRVEFEYERHGTLNLIANFNIAKGTVDTPMINPTRDEEDFAWHIEQTVAADPGAAGWVFVTDNLNTHKSASLVRLVAEICQIPQQSLGVKERSGILKSMKSREEFLTQASHKVRFVYTPKHCSWLNQVELWFSILSRKLLKWGNFKSLEDLEDKLLRFIQYFNQTMAKPFKWTFKGFPLRI